MHTDDELKSILQVNRPFWFLGANWSGEDQTSRFVEQGIWG